MLGFADVDVFNENAIGKTLETVTPPLPPYPVTSTAFPNIGMGNTTLPADFLLDRAATFACFKAAN